MKKEIESYTIVLTWKHEDGSWNTETLNQDNLPDSFLDYLKEYERVENETENDLENALDFKINKWGFDKSSK